MLFSFPTKFKANIDLNDLPCILIYSEQRVCRFMPKNGAINYLDFILAYEMKKTLKQIGLKKVSDSKTFKLQFILSFSHKGIHYHHNTMETELKITFK